MSRRSSNFSKGEVDYLLKLIEKRKHVLECKKIDRNSCEEKVKAWIEIELEFNKKLGHNFRNAEALRTKYKNLKKTMKPCGNSSDTKFTLIKKFAGQFERLIDIDSICEDHTIETNDTGEDSIETLPSVDIRKEQVHELQIKNMAKEHNSKMKRQELEISVLEKEHHLKIAKMELEIHILEQQLHQMKKRNNNKTGSLKKRKLGSLVISDFKNVINRVYENPFYSEFFKPFKFIYSLENVLRQCNPKPITIANMTAEQMKAIRQLTTLLAFV